MVPRRILGWLALLAVVLPMAVLVVLGAAKLLTAMNDAGGAEALERVALAGGIAWVIALVLLVVALGVNAMHD